MPYCLCQGDVECCYEEWDVGEDRVIGDRYQCIVGLVLEVQAVHISKVQRTDHRIGSSLHDLDVSKAWIDVLTDCLIAIPLSRRRAI